MTNPNNELRLDDREKRSFLSPPLSTLKHLTNPICNRISTSWLSPGECHKTWSGVKTEINISQQQHVVRSFLLSFFFSSLAKSQSTNISSGETLSFLEMERLKSVKRQEGAGGLHLKLFLLCIMRSVALFCLFIFAALNFLTAVAHR